MHIDRIPVYRVYQRAIDLELYHSFAELVVQTSQDDTARRTYRQTRAMQIWQVETDVSGYFEPYHLRYPGEVLERFEEKLGDDVQVFRALALALGNTCAIQSDNMFVGNQRGAFLQKLRRSAGEDVYLQGALHLLETDAAQRHALLEKLAEREYMRTEEALFVLSLFDDTERGYEAILSGEKRLLEMLNLEKGEICIGASDMTLKYYLLPYLERFHEKYPNIRVTVTNAPTPETLQHLADGRIDFGIVSSPVEPQGWLKIIPVKEIRDVFVAGKKYKELCGRKMQYKELSEYPLMCLEGSTSTRHYVEAFLEEEGVTVSPEFELATSDMLIQFALRNLGIASVMEEFAKEYEEDGRLFKLQFEKEIPARKFCIVLNERIPMSAAAAKLLKGLL